MKVSVLIPAYNSAATLSQTLESALSQTHPDYEILAIDDGSTDGTLGVLQSVKEKVTIFRGEHSGAACARNLLCRHARGDLVAFLDSDDIWHPQYLERQCAAFRRYPDGTAFFTGHVDFCGYQSYAWTPTSASCVDYDRPCCQQISPLRFLTWYKRGAAPFASLSYCCVPKNKLEQLGDRPFDISGAEDTYLLFLLALMGPVILNPEALVAYRVTDQSLSSDRLTVLCALTKVFEALEDRYRSAADPDLYKAFKSAAASRRREYAKLLMGTGSCSDARHQLADSVHDCADLTSIGKSLGLLVLTHLPSALQPKWPSRYRAQA
jgi:glycosyltransferase involved in cell wall biosynthesis